MLINIPLQIDDAAIEGKLTREYEERVLASVNERIDKCLKSHDPSWNSIKSPSYGLEHMIDNRIYECIDKFLEANRDDIIAKAADNLALRLSRSKKGKAILDRYEEENNE